MTVRGLIVAAVLVSVVASGATAQPAPFRYRPEWHGGLAGAAALGSVLVALAERGDEPRCRWCGVDPQGRLALPAIDRWGHDHLGWHQAGRADTMSDATALGAYLLPLAGLAAVHGGLGGEFGRDLLAAVSSVAVAQFAADLTKEIVRRSRPPIVFDGAPITSPSDVHSFISGHAATTAAAGLAVATIASRRQSRHARWIWATGVSLAGTTGYLRMAAHRHYLTDVLAGAAVGGAIGVVVPRLFDRAAGTDAQSGAAGAGPIVGIGPTAQLGVRRLAGARVQLAAGPGGIGLVGALRLP